MICNAHLKYANKIKILNYVYFCYLKKTLNAIEKSFTCSLFLDYYSVRCEVMLSFKIFLSSNLDLMKPPRSLKPQMRSDAVENFFRVL